MDPNDYAYYLCTPHTFRPCMLHPVRWLDWEADFALAEAFWRVELTYPMWLEARELVYEYAAVIENGKIISCAAAWNYSAEKSELSAVCTNDPALRCRGYAKSVCSFITAAILQRGQIATVSTAIENIPMQRTAESIGYQRISVEEGMRHQHMMNLHLQQRLAALKK